MKRFTLIVMLALVTAMPTFAERVPMETARKVAATFLNNNGAKSVQLTDLSTEAGFPNLYIFNTGQGFVVMAADDRVQPILGYSLTGEFLVNGMPENVKWWLQGYSDQIQDVIDYDTKTTEEVKKQWTDLENGIADAGKSRAEVGPLITTQWDQTYPYNYYCPSCSSGGHGGHVYTGCVATAMAQVIKYYNSPVHGIGSHSYIHNLYGTQTANFGETYYNWTNMPTKVYSYSNSNQIQAVATLMYHCGVAVEMNYGTNGSGASSLAIAPALQDYFNFSQSTTYVDRSNYTNNQWISLMRNELNASRPNI